MSISKANEGPLDKLAEEMLATFHDSIDRCQESDNFYDVFYVNFIGSSEKVREKFAETDLVKQKRMLRKSLVMILLALQGDVQAEEYLMNIARRHSKAELDIKPELYDNWLESLIATVKSNDSCFSPKVEIAWRTVMGRGIQYMISYYDS